MRIVFLIIIWCISQSRIALALDWKAAHEEADRENIPQAQAAAQAAPNSIRDLYILGLVYLNVHEDKLAGEAFEKILNLDPKSVEAAWGKAEVLRRQHEAKESEVLLQDVLKENPEFSPAYISLAYLKYRQMNFNEAVKLATKVLQQNESAVDLSNHVRAHLMIAGAKGMIAHYGGPLSKVINGTSVLPSLKKAEAAKPDDAAVLFGLGSFYLLAPTFVGKDLEMAEQYLTKAIQKDPKFVDIYVRLAQVYKLKGDEAKYSEYIQKASEIDPRNELLVDITSGQCSLICVGKAKDYTPP